VLVALTSLKPGGPTEIVELREEPSGVTIAVRRVSLSDGEGKAEEGSAAIERAQFDALWSRIVRADLRTAPPPQTDDGVHDGAGYILLIEWPGDGAQHVHALSWRNAKEPQAAIDALFNELGSLARTRVPGVSLHYLR
jgi:hypothetical protein